MNIKKSITNLLFGLLISLLFCFSSAAFAADIQVKIDRTKVELNETFTLIFEASEDPDDDPDFSPLEKDFQVLGTNTSSNMSIINGSYSRSKKWNVTLIALHKGSITIPSISFGNDRSPTYQIDIKEPQQSSGKQGEAFISELNISTSSAYPQQQIIVTQRLLSSSNINAYEFSPLKISGVEANREALGEIKQYQTKRGDTAYLVLERSFAIYPQSAGQLTIAPSVASARIAIQGNIRSRSAFDPFRNNTKTVRRSSTKKIISINAIPKQFKAKHWLVAKEVQLVEEFPEATNFKVGEPITRTLLLISDGQNTSQLPEFMTQAVKGLKQYPDKPLLKNNASDTGITGVQQLKVAIIPSTTGTYTLPAIAIPWWNIQTQKLEYAKIPARIFSVDAASDSVNTTTQTAQLNSGKEVVIDNAQPNTDASTSNTGAEYNSDNTSLIWKIISMLLAISLLVTLFLLWKKPKPQVHKTNQKIIDTPSLKQALKNINLACDNNDPQATKNALLDWSKALFINQPVHSLGDLCKQVDTDLAEKLQSLNATLYRNNSENWQCDTLYSLCIKFTENFNNQMKHSDKTAKIDNLESLYK